MEYKVVHFALLLLASTCSGAVSSHQVSHGFENNYFSPQDNYDQIRPEFNYGFRSRPGFHLPLFPSYPLYPYLPYLPQESPSPSQNERTNSIYYPQFSPKPFLQLDGSYQDSSSNYESYYASPKQFGSKPITSPFQNNEKGHTQKEFSLYGIYPNHNSDLGYQTSLTSEHQTNSVPDFHHSKDPKPHFYYQNFIFSPEYYFIHLEQPLNQNHIPQLLPGQNSPFNGNFKPLNQDLRPITELNQFDKKPDFIFPAGYSQFSIPFSNGYQHFDPATYQPLYQKHFLQHPTGSYQEPKIHGAPKNPKPDANEKPDQPLLEYTNENISQESDDIDEVLEPSNSANNPNKDEEMSQFFSKALE